MIECSKQEATYYRKEIRKCRNSPSYFLDTYGQIYDATSREWVPFRLWQSQFQTLKGVAGNRLIIILKARQLGLTWLVLGYALWLMIFHPAATVLLFSRRDDEAVDLLRTRLRGMYDRLPAWLKVRSFSADNDHEWGLSNGSRVLAFPTTAGDSYTGTLVIVDEADLVPDLGRLMRAVKPTIDGGGKMILLSRADKSQPQSVFKRIYKAAMQNETEWAGLFLPWSARPGRNQEWYDAQKAEVVHRTGSLDDLHEQYPATDMEALSPRLLPEQVGDYCPECGFAEGDIRVMIISMQDMQNPKPFMEVGPIGDPSALVLGPDDLCSICGGVKAPIRIIQVPPELESEMAPQ